MSEDAHFSGFDPMGNNDDEIIFSSKSPHELLRKAITVLETHDTVLITADMAMELIMEYDAAKAGKEFKPGDLDNLFPTDHLGEGSH
jgi:hypothetical protein